MAVYTDEFESVGVAEGIGMILKSVENSGFGDIPDADAIRKKKKTWSWCTEWRPALMSSRTPPVLFIRCHDTKAPHRKSVRVQRRWTCGTYGYT